MRIELVAKRSTWLRSAALLAALSLYFGYSALSSTSLAGRGFFVLIVALNGAIAYGNVRKWLATRSNPVRVAECDEGALTLPRLTDDALHLAKGDIVDCTIATMRSTMMIAVRAKDRRTAVLTSSDWEMDGLARLAAALRDAGLVTKDS
jgi:hypothetical protein